MIGDRIKSARLKLGYSAEQIADFLKVSPATVYRYENGDISKLPAKFIKPLAEFLCVTPAYLMEWDYSDERYDAFINDYLEKNKSVGPLQSEEADLVLSYRSLTERGQQLLQERVVELSQLHGKKSEDSSDKSV